MRQKPQSCESFLVQVLTSRVLPNYQYPISQCEMLIRAGRGAIASGIAWAKRTNGFSGAIRYRRFGVALTAG
jgi:hypothetical protein